MRGFVHQYRWIFYCAAGFSFLINLLLLAPAIFMLQVFDRVLTSRSAETLFVLAAGVAVALLLMMALEVIRARLLSLAGIAFDKLYSPLVLEAEIARAAQLGGAGSGYGMHDVTTLRRFFSGFGVLALFDAPWALFFLGVIVLIHPVLGLTAGVGMAVLLLLTWLNERLAHRPVMRTQAASQQALHHFGASLRNAEVVSGLGMTKDLSARWALSNAELLGSQETASNVAGFIGGASKFTRQALQSAMLAIAALLVLRQEVSAGAMIAATIIFGRALQPVEILIASWRSLVESRAAYRRLLDLMPQGGHRDCATELAPPTGKLTVSDVRFSPPGRDRPILQSVSFELSAGETLCVLGPSGSGKSTLARLLIGIWKPTGGSVRLDGADIGSWRRDRLGPYLGYLPQDVELFGGTVSENIARLGAAESRDIIEAATLANAHELILRLPQGYDSHIGEGGAMLSGGQRQRIALARALYGNPRIVVLDEPDSSLDAEGEAALLRVMERLKRNGVTQIVVSHRPSVVAMADRVLVIGEGLVQYFGLREDILSRLRQLVRARDGLNVIDASRGKP